MVSVIFELTSQLSQNCMKHFDKDGNGEIDYQEMAQFMGEELY